VNEQLEIRQPRISFHDSGLCASHDQACGICQQRHALYRIDLDVFAPCWECQSEGWELKQPSGWVPRWVRRLLDRRSA
jgi:hypothetical protein